jgi:hypothetical protein
MTLADLLAEIQRAPGAVTVGDLAARLGTSPAEVRAMLAALRASGRLGPSRGVTPGSEQCSSSCAVSCPGPAECPFVVDFGTGLEPR